MFSIERFVFLVMGGFCFGWLGRLERGENDPFLLFLPCYPFVVSCIVKDGEERK